MFIHELPKADKGKAVKVFHDALKNNGRLIIWKPLLNDDTAEFYRKVIQEKDRLAGFDVLASDRYFLTENELMDLFKAHQFEGLKLEAEISYELYSKNRLEQEFGGNIDTLKAWNDSIIELDNNRNKNDLTPLEHIADDNILIHFKRGLYKLVKHEVGS